MCSFKVGKTDLEDSLDIFEDIYSINNGKIINIFLLMEIQLILLI